MKSNWKTCQLGDLITFQRGHDLPKTKMQGGKYPVVGSNGIIGYHNEYTTEAPSITIGRSGNVGKPFLFKGRSWSHNTSLYIKEYNAVDPIFIYYFLQTLDLGNYAGGSAVPTLNRNHIHTLNVYVPTDIDEQRRMGAVLSVIDDKIELNTAINENLESQAQALFKSWFLDYEPWDGFVPDSWNSGKLGDFAEIKRGGSPRPIQEYLFDSGLRWLKISDVTSLQTPFIIDIKDHIIEAGLRKTVFLKAGSLVLSNSATPGVPKILDVDSCIHDGWLYFPESKFSKEYLYLYFKYIRQQLVNLSNGSVFNNLKTDILKGYPTILPDKDTLRRFDDIVVPMFLQMQNLTRESHKLADMRNALLPKLMNGEIDVSEVKI